MCYQNIAIITDTAAHHYGYQGPVATNPAPPNYNTQPHGG